MTMIEIDNIINNIDNYNDEELLKIHNDVYKTLFESYRFIEADEFVILLIKKIKDINTKITLIKRYLMDPIRLYNLFKSISNLSYDDKKIILKAIFNNKYESIKETLDIPSNYKFGLELEYNELSFNALELLFKSDSINALMDVLEVDHNISNDIINNTVFKYVSDYSKWRMSVEMDDEHLPELSTPILYNNIDDLNKLKAFYSIMETLKAKVSGWTALQINVGVDSFKNTEAFKYLFSIWEECEELFYKIANKEGTVIRPYASNMARPIKEDIQNSFNEGFSFEVNTEDDLYRLLYNIQVRDDLYLLLKYPFIENEDDFYKYVNAENEEEKYEVFRNLLTYSKKDIMNRIKCKSINFTHMSPWDKENKGRIEFRLFNNIMDFETIKLNIELIGKLVYVSNELADKNINLLDKYNELLNIDVSEEEKLNLLLDLLFDDSNKKDIFKRRWESVNDKSLYSRFSTGKPTFKVDKNKQLKKTTF